MKRLRPAALRCLTLHYTEPPDLSVGGSCCLSAVVLSLVPGFWFAALGCMAVFCTVSTAFCALVSVSSGETVVSEVPMVMPLSATPLIASSAWLAMASALALVLAVVSGSWR